MRDIVIIGGGFAGCSSAEMLSNLKNTKVTIIEKSNFLGAGVRTFFYGGHPYTYGPRHFITKNFETYKYLNKFVKLRNVNYHEFKCYVESEDNFYNYPISLEDIKNMKEKKKIMIIECLSVIAEQIQVVHPTVVEIGLIVFCINFQFYR